MGASPAFSFYAKDFLTGTATMSLEERGAYVSFLAYQWDSGAVPRDPHERARILGCTKAQEKAIWLRLANKFAPVDAGYQNHRLEEERQKQFERRRRLSDNGKLGGRPKANGKQDIKLDESKRFDETKASGNLNERLAFSSSSSKEQEPHAKRSDDRFETWWVAYPKKTGKGAALNAWKRLRPNDATIAQMHEALSWQRHQPQWTKESGAFVPNPATYLNQRRWEDEPFFSAPARVPSSVPSPEETSRMLADRMAKAGQ